MVVATGSGIQIYTADTSASHTISISGFVPEIVKIDRKYLPSPLIIDDTNLPTDASGWEELHKQIDSAYKERREILLKYYNINTGTELAHCIAWNKNKGCALFIKYMSSNVLYMTKLSAMINGEGGGYEDYNITLTVEEKS